MFDPTTLPLTTEDAAFALAKVAAAVRATGPVVKAADGLADSVRSGLSGVGTAASDAWKGLDPLARASLGNAAVGAGVGGLAGAAYGASDPRRRSVGGSALTGAVLGGAGAGGITALGGQSAGPDGKPVPGQVEQWLGEGDPRANQALLDRRGLDYLKQGPVSRMVSGANLSAPDPSEYGHNPQLQARLRDADTITGVATDNSGAIAAGGAAALHGTHLDKMRLNARAFASDVAANGKGVAAAPYADSTVPGLTKKDPPVPIKGLNSIFKETAKPGTNDYARGKALEAFRTKTTRPLPGISPGGEAVHPNVQLAINRGMPDAKILGGQGLKGVAMRGVGRFALGAGAAKAAPYVGDAAKGVWDYATGK